MKSKIRVLFISGEYPVMQGGVGDYTRELGRALMRTGAEVHVLTRVTAGRAPEGEPVVHPLLTGMGWGLWQTAARLIGRLRPNVVHIQYQPAAYDLNAAINWLPWFLRRRSDGINPRLCVTFHDLREPYMFPKAGPLRWRSVLALANHSDESVVTNPTDLARLGLADARLADRLHAIPIGSNIIPRPPEGYDRPGQRARWGVGPGDWLMGYFGFLNANKGGETLVRALHELVQREKPAHLLMVGGQVGASDPTNATYLAHVKSMIDRSRLANRVHWTGFTLDAEVTANLLADECAVLPYLEGASLRHGSLMAALAHGLPVITTAASVPAEVAAANRCFPLLEHGTSVWLVPPDRPSLLADGVIRVMDDANLRRHLGEGALNLAEHFSWGAIAAQHMQLYASMGAR